MHVAFAVFFAVFFIIGVCTFLLGCNPKYGNLCVAYDLVDCTVYGYKFEKTTCKRCVARTKNGACVVWETYDCYFSYLRFQYDNNQTCLFTAVAASTSNNTAHRGAVKYPLGYERTLIKRKNSSECISTGVGLDTWITGVFFLCLCVAMVVAFVGEKLGFWSLEDEQHRVFPQDEVRMVEIPEIREF